MLEKMFYKMLLSCFFKNVLVKVVFWDYFMVIYGDGDLEIIIIFNEKILVVDVMCNVLLVLGEVFMDKKIEFLGLVNVIEILINVVY